MICSSGFYSNESGNCSEVKTKILNCLYYDTSVTCTLCDKNTVLSKDKKLCYSEVSYTSLIPFNCDYSLEIDSYECSMCFGGYYLNQGKC